MMGPHVYEAARADAPIPVQLMRIGSAPRPRNADSVRIHGRIVRTFRDPRPPAPLGPARQLHHPRHQPGQPFREALRELSGTIYHDWDRMGRACAELEAFLESWEGKLHLVHSQVLAIRHPTRHPVCGPDAKRGLLVRGKLLVGLRDGTTMKSSIHFFAAAAAVASLTACAETAPKPSISQVRVAPSAATVSVGGVPCDSRQP